MTERYTELLARMTGITLPTVPGGYQSVWAQYSILPESNEDCEHLQSRLKENENTNRHIFSKAATHLQTAYEYLRYEKVAFPISEDYSECIFSVPMYPYLKPEDQERIKKILATA